MKRNVPSVNVTQLSPLGTGLWLGKRPLFEKICAFSGDARLLGVSVVDMTTPIGILLDRLAEHPEECDCPPDELEAAIAYLRERNPNGNESNW